MIVDGCNKGQHWGTASEQPAAFHTEAPRSCTCAACILAVSSGPERMFCEAATLGELFLRVWIVVCWVRFEKGTKKEREKHEGRAVTNI